MRVLIVDDVDFIREGIRAILSNSEEDLEIHEAGDGYQAVDLSQKMDFDIILMDISMPNMNGITATREIMKAKPSSIIVGVSMHTDKEDIAKMEKAGAKGYILKDSIANTLSGSIKLALTKADFFYRE